MGSNISRWSFGGNRLQVKAEVQLLADVALACQSVAATGSKLPSLRPLNMKQDLLQTLLSSEQSRLLVWLYPMENGGRGQGWTEVRILSIYPVALLIQSRKMYVASYQWHGKRILQSQSTSSRGFHLSGLPILYAGFC